MDTKNATMHYLLSSNYINLKLTLIALNPNYNFALFDMLQVYF